MSIYETQRDLRKLEQSLYARLKSIRDDSFFVARFLHIIPQIGLRDSDFACEGLPLVANLRCGEWYSPAFDDVCYFKSTDGHYGQWLFNLRRINLNIVAWCASHGGCVLVDSTRKGKLFPDSFNRTVPLWSAVINRSLAKIFNHTGAEWQTLAMPPWISESEKFQISNRLDGYVKDVLENEPISAKLKEIGQDIRLPLRALCVRRGSPVWRLDNEEPQSLRSLLAFDFHPVVCLSVSNPQEQEGSGYIQGAGDDEESWARNLRPKAFWENEKFILSSEEDIVDRVDMVVSQAASTLQTSTPLKEAQLIHFQGREIAMATGASYCSFDGELTYKFPEGKYLHVPLPGGKKIRRHLIHSLPAILNFATAHFTTDSATPSATEPSSSTAQTEWTSTQASKTPYTYPKESLLNALYTLQQSGINHNLPRVYIQEMSRFFVASHLNMNEPARSFWSKLRTSS